MSSLVIASLVAVAVLVGAVGTGVATLSSSNALPDACRPVTLYAVGGQGGSADVLRGVTDPIAKQFGEKVSVVTVPAPPAGGSFASAEADAVGSLARAVGEHVDGCPTGSLMLFGYSQGAQVAGDLASRVGTGLEPRIPAKLVQAVGLFGDPARSPRTRAVPDGTTGQGALPPRAVGFGSLDARTIEICAPNDPVCDSPPTAAAPPIEQAVASAVHGSYEQLPVAAGTTAPRWAAASLAKVVAAIPHDAGPAMTAQGTAPQSGTGGTTSSQDPDATGPTGTGATSETSSGTGSATTGSGATGNAGPVTTTPPASRTGTGTGSSAEGGAGTGGAYEGGGTDGSYEDGGGAVTPAKAPSGSSTTGDPADAAAVSTRRSGSAASESTDTSGSTGTGARTSSSDTGSGTSGTVSSGEGSVETSSPSESAQSRGTTASSRTGSSGRGSASEDPTTTTKRAAEKTGKDAGKDKDKGTDTGKGTGAAFSLIGGLDGFKSTPWNNQGATDPSPAASPNVPGRKAVKFEMPGGGKRTEAEPDIPQFTEGEKAFVGYSGFFDRGFPTDTGTWQLIMQFKQPGTGSPPLAVEVGEGQLRLANDGGSEKDFCPVGQGAFSFQLGVTFGGAIDAWCNGKQTLIGYTTPKSNVQGSAYLKTGIYRDESIEQDSTLFLNDLKVGTTLESVSGLAGAGTSDQASPTDPAGTTTTPATPAPAAAVDAGDSSSYVTAGAGGGQPPGTASAPSRRTVTSATDTAGPTVASLAYRPPGGSPAAFRLREG